MVLAARLFKLTPQECLAGVTRNAARALRLDHNRGTLEPGKLADFVVLSDDPRDVPADEIEVEMTVVGGKTVFAR